jgi:2-dehydro-3-deoxyglucarate aldolase/4-hydroxy-2-oxoheptanedioate aldolase
MIVNKASFKPVIGTIFTIGSPQVAEIISQSGFEWVLIDMEHSTLSLDSVQNALQVLGEKIIRIVRVPGNDEIWIKRVLDTGCDGILVPMVKNADEARRVVNSSKYPTEGERSVGLTRAHNYGPGFNEYVSGANKNLIIMIQIEHIGGVKNIDSILKVRGIDSIFIGPYDLSASMGLMGQVNHPEVRKAINLIKEKCRSAGKPYGIFGMDPKSLEMELRDGCTFLLCGVDLSIFSESYASIIERLNKSR